MNQTANGPSASTQTLAARLGQARVGLRADLETSRHLFRGEPAYVLRDPVTFQSHQFTAEDYSILVCLGAQRTLSETFDLLVEQGIVAADEQENFYRFIASLHQMGFLNLPISDEKALYKRHQARNAAKRKQLWMAFISYQFPGVNPDAFLDRTVRYFRFIFTPWFFLFWLALIGLAGYVAAANWRQFTEPLGGIFTVGNIAALWSTLIILKLFHEAGHAYACKNFGGHVPETGILLMLMTPCAFVDASACWGFTRKSHRLIVCLAGMYVELMIAAVAVLIWSTTEPGPLNSLCYNIVLLASVTTIAFNINPLMKFDGYYILMDMLEVPNLRQKSTSYATGVLKSLLLGIPNPHKPAGWSLKATLLSYGVLVSLYRISVTLGIATMIALQYFWLGITLGAAYLGMEFFRILANTLRCLWWSRETQPVRVRAVAISIILLLVLPAAAIFTPVSSSVHSQGIVGRLRQQTIRAELPGVVHQVIAQTGRDVEPGQPLVMLDSSAPQELLIQTQANLATARLLLQAASVEPPAVRQEHSRHVELYQNQLIERRNHLEKLTIRATEPGHLVDCMEPSHLGSYIQPGQPIATLVSGPLTVTMLLDESQMADARPFVGQPVRFRPPGFPLRTYNGSVIRIVPAGSADVDHPALAMPGGGAIPVDAQGIKALRTLFTVVIQMDEPPAGLNLQHGLRGNVEFPGLTEPLGAKALRSLVRFIDRLH